MLTPFESAAEWLDRLATATPQERAAFVHWVRQSPQNFGDFLKVTALQAAIDETFRVEPVMPTAAHRTAAYRLRGHAQKYWMPLLQILSYRQIDRDNAERLVHCTVREVAEKMGRLTPQALPNFPRQLYRTACKLASGHFLRLACGRTPPSEDTGADRASMATTKVPGIRVEGEADEGEVANAVRDLALSPTPPRDRAVLTRLFVQEHSRAQVCEDLRLSESQFDQALVRIRRRFAERVLRRGQPTDPVGNSRYVILAANYVCRALGKQSIEDFELKMMNIPACVREVQLWSALKLHLPRS